MSIKRVLVTGNNGYIGPLVESALALSGFEVTGLDTNYFEDCYIHAHPRLPKQITRDIRQVEKGDLDGVDAVVHLAALSNDPMGALDESVTNAINFQATQRLAELCKKNGVQRFVYASSCSIYGVADTSSAVTEEALLTPQTAYARSKINSEKYLSTLADKNFSPVLMRNATAYGVSPRLRLDLVLNNLVAWASATKKIRILSDGTPWRPIAHVSDIAKATVCILKAPRESIHNEAFNVGSNENNYRVREMAEMVKKIVPDCKIEYAPGYKGDSRTYRVNFDKIGRHVKDFAPAWNLEKGVKELFRACTDAHLSLKDIESDRYIRLERLATLRETGRLDDNLYWKAT